jgi:preprotein translocase subunit YajC
LETLAVNLFDHSILAQSDGPSFASQPAPTTAQPAAPGPGAQPKPAGGSIDFIVLIGFGVIGALLISQIFAQRRERKRMDEMLSSMKKHDQVRTVGGIIGSVVEVKPDEVVIKVDEDRGTTLRVARNRIEVVIKDSSAR